MAAIDLSNPAQDPLTGGGTFGGAGIAQEFTLAAARPDMVFSIYLYGGPGKYTTDPAIDNGEAIGANYGEPIAAGAPAGINLPGGSAALTKLCVSSDAGGTDFRYSYGRVVQRRG